MSARRNARLSGDNGAVVVEAALVLPIIMFFIMGAIDFGFLELRTSQMSSAARDGARVGILQYAAAETGSGPAFVAIDTAVRSRLAGAPVNSVTVRCYQGASGVFPVTCTGRLVDVDTIEVRVNWTFTSMTPVGQTFFGTTKTFTSTARMTIIGRPI